MKKCIHCALLLSKKNFSKDKRQNDGYSYYCRSCKKEIRQPYEEAHRKESILRSYRWRKTEIGKKSLKKTYNKMKRLYPERYKARTILNNSVLRGVTIRPNSCSKCHKYNKRIVAHHEDYSRPLDVIWCCDSCHKFLDMRKILVCRAS